MRRRTKSGEGALPLAQRLFAALVLVVAGCGGDPAAELIGQLQQGEVQQRREAARALGELGPAAEAAVPVLAASLDDLDADVRRLCAHALGEVGGRAQEALPALAAALDDRQISVRLSAAYALARIDPAGRAYVEVLAEAMRMGEGGVIVAVGRMEPPAEWAIPTLIDLLMDRRAGIRRLAAEALGRIGNGSQDVRAALERALDDDDDRVRDAARRALEQIHEMPASS